MAEKHGHQHGQIILHAYTSLKYNITDSCISITSWPWKSIHGRDGKWRKGNGTIGRGALLAVASKQPNNGSYSQMSIGGSWCVPTMLPLVCVCIYRDRPSLAGPCLIISKMRKIIGGRKKRNGTVRCRLWELERQTDTVEAEMWRVKARACRAAVSVCSSGPDPGSVALTSGMDA